MIHLEDLTEKDVGRYVIYTDEHPFEGKERGRIKSWNDKFIFVVYKCDDDWDNFKNYTGAATYPGNLKFVDPEPDENWNEDDNLDRFEILDL